MRFNTSIAVLAAATAVLATLPASAQTATENWRIGGLQTPESVIVDSANSRLIVTNMTVFGPDGGTDGYLSTVNPADGSIIEAQFATGLMDPKGMAIVGDSLFVADSNGLVEVSLADGSIITTHTLEGAQFPNDVTADASGAIYVTDMFGASIYRVVDGAAEIWLQDPVYGMPNGVFADGDTIVIGAFGKDMQPDFSVGTPGGLYIVDAATKAITPAEGATEMAVIDGVARIGDWLIFNDNPGGKIFAWSEGSAAVEIATPGPGSADLFADGNMLYVPQTGTGELIAYSVE